jgi:thymidylate synthase
MILADQLYKRNLRKILKSGFRDGSPRPKYKDGTPAHTLFLTQVFEEYDISRGQFPIPTLRNTAIKTGIKEILWIYQAQSNSLKKAHDMGIKWWDEWDVGDDTIGKRYGYTVGAYKLMDELLEGLIKDPFGRRHIISLYQYEHLQSSPGLYPCAFETLWSVTGDGKLDMTLIQRSNDYIMAGYINKIQYVALQMMVAKCVGLDVGKFCHFVQNLHIYDRHIPAAKEIIARYPVLAQPSLHFSSESNDFYKFSVADFSVEDDFSVKLESELEIAV